MAARSDSEDKDEGIMIPEVAFERQEDFMQEIHGRFLEFIEPRESGLLDHLRETVMDSDTEQEIMAQTTTRDKARKLWQVLHCLPLEDFRDHCYPILKTLYPHVLKGARFIPNTRKGDSQKCIRHDIMARVKLRRFADLFPPLNACTLQEYNKITEGEADDSKWDLAFKVCARNKKNDSFIQQLQATLQNIKVRIPSDFPAVLSKGFPCSYKHQRQLRTLQAESFLAKPIAFKREADGMFFDLGNWKTQESNECVSSCGYPSTLESSDDKENFSVSISSHETTNEVVGESSEEEFDTQEQKDACLKELERTNALIQKASNIRPFFRELSGIKEELSILEGATKSDSMHSFEDQGKKHRLEKRARLLYDKIQTDFKAVEEAAKTAGDTGLPSTLELPSARRKILLHGKQMLLNEVNEACGFFKQSESLFRSMRFTLTDIIKEEIKPEGKILFGKGTERSAVTLSSGTTYTCRPQY